jgi:diguanylate cyclase (GGDEF)-like protein
MKPAPEHPTPAQGAPLRPSRLERALGESPISLAVLALLVLLPVLAAWVLLAMGTGRAIPQAQTLRTLGAVLLASAFTLALFVGWMLHGLRRQLVRLRAMAVTDLLTGVGNRRVFVQALERELDLARRHGFPVSVVVIEIDTLNEINREHGLAMGDQVLAVLAQRLSEHLRDSDLLARTGGASFALLLSHLGPEQAAAAARRFRTVINWQPLAVGDTEIAVTGSFGVASQREPKGLSVQGLLEVAQQGAKRAAGQGGDSVVVWAARSTPEAGHEE